MSLAVGFDRVEARVAEVLVVPLARVRVGDAVASALEGDAAARGRDGDGIARPRDGDDDDAATAARVPIGKLGAMGLDGDAADARDRVGPRRASSRVRSCSRLRCVIGGTVSPKFTSSCRNC